MILPRIKVVHNKQLPSRLPTWPTVTAWLALDHWHAPQWLYGAVFCFLLILWILVIVNMYREEQTLIWPEKP